MLFIIPAIFTQIWLCANLSEHIYVDFIMYSLCQHTGGLTVLLILLW